MYYRFLLFISLFLVLSATAVAGTFPDVPSEHENFVAIEYLVENAVVKGYSDNTFKPEVVVNRAEAVKILVEAFTIEKNVIGGGFLDVNEADWFFEHVMAAQEAGIIGGYDDGTFKPGDTINLAETLKIVPLAADWDVPMDVNVDVFVDVPAGLWYTPYAHFAREKNLLLADDNGNIGIGEDMTRGDFAELIYRMMHTMEGGVYNLSSTWPDYEGRDLPFVMKYDKWSWDVVSNEGEVVFYKGDADFGLLSSDRVYPNSAKVVVSLDDNSSDVSKTEYFANLKAAFAGATFTEFALGEFMTLEVLRADERQVDWYLYLEDGRVLAVYTEYGDGVLAFQFPKIISAMLTSLQYKSVTGSNREDILSEIFENILIEGVGMETLNLLPEKVIVETDTIGVGTGPVDYYYCESYDYTFKYERSADLILDKREGQTTAF